MVQDSNGKFSGSRISDLMKCGRKKEETWSETARSYIYQVAGERLFNEKFLEDDGIFQDYLDLTSVSTKAMQFGSDQEDAAKSLFMQMNFPEGEITELSSCKHDTIPYFAASPDGAIYGMKYRTLIHDAASLKETEPKYYWQMMAEMSCTGATSGIFITYCPWLSKPIHWAEIERNRDDVKLMESRVMLANEFIDEIINK